MAAEYDDKIFKDPYVAYDKYANSGVIKSDSDGNAVLEFRKPQGYNVPYKSKRINPHVHYRECFYNGMLDSVKTLYIIKYLLNIYFIIINNNNESFRCGSTSY